VLEQRLRRHLGCTPQFPSCAKKEPTHERLGAKEDCGRSKGEMDYAEASKNSDKICERRGRQKEANESGGEEEALGQAKGLLG
jgi:hypothetical protein